MRPHRAAVIRPHLDLQERYLDYMILLSYMLIHGLGPIPQKALSTRPVSSLE
jgi:hypothetical protein